MIDILYTDCKNHQRVRAIPHANCSNLLLAALACLAAVYIMYYLDIHAGNQQIWDNLLINPNAFWEDKFLFYG
eukprot:snap_masked-scaffold_21-processed-gene-5.51-mRNA-1 protein AED:1.00 eAED:1.00 QI:0/0/0/0/1/1/2/0/72